MKLGKLRRNLEENKVVTMSKFDLEEFAKTADRIRRKAIEENRLLDNPSDEELRLLVEKEPGIKKTIYGNYVAESEPTSRAAMFTENSVDHPFGEEELQLLAQCEKALAKEKLISIDRIVGNESSETTVRLIVPEGFAHVAYGGKNLFIPVKKEVKEPTYQILFFTDEAFEANKSKPLPQKDITIRLAMLDDGRVIKIVRNSNYIGEFKKGVFAAEDWNAKTRRGGIFLHAGCREDYLQSAHGDYRNIRTLLLALSANGKTTTTCRILARKGKEKSWLIQDDGGTLMPDGSFHGFEAGGVFVKTESVNPGEQLGIYYGLLKPGILCENVYVNEDGDFDFFNLERTSNGRAVILRRDFMHASPYIDVDKIDNLILITRGPLIPAIAKLTMEQAVALMILGQAMESSAGDPTQAGKIRSEFFYDPFVAGDRAEHANRFYEMLKGLPHMNYFLLNTGGVGEGARYKEIRLEHTMAILDSLLRRGFEDWIDSPTGFKVPKAIRMVDDIYLHPEKLYSRAEFEEKQKELNRFRREAIEKIGGALHPDIKKVFSEK
ncbi:MAG: phosphoenolpyruvate carboxykinase [Candidatus Bathyarchaeota archaeon BA2]|nr:MAG: phosphoenolpyruvate carboxykinase [Candidatus Bathyarchaeota archaeon BA2]